MLEKREVGGEGEGGCQREGGVRGRGGVRWRVGVSGGGGGVSALTPTVSLTKATIMFEQNWSRKLTLTVDAKQAVISLFTLNDF